MMDLFYRLERGRGFETECAQTQPASTEELKEITQETLYWVASDMRKTANSFAVLHGEKFKHFIRYCACFLMSLCL
jgi:hypothetical protein